MSRLSASSAGLIRGGSGAGAAQAPLMNGECYPTLPCHGHSRRGLLLPPAGRSRRHWPGFLRSAAGSSASSCAVDFGRTAQLAPNCVAQRAGAPHSAAHEALGAAPGFGAQRS